MTHNDNILTKYRLQKSRPYAYNMYVLRADRIIKLEMGKGISNVKFEWVRLCVWLLGGKIGIFSMNYLESCNLCGVVVSLISCV